MGNARPNYYKANVVADLHVGVYMPTDARHGTKRITPTSPACPISRPVDVLYFGTWQTSDVSTRTRSRASDRSRPGHNLRRTRYGDQTTLALLLAG